MLWPWIHARRCRLIPPGQHQRRVRVVTEIVGPGLRQSRGTLGPMAESFVDTFKTELIADRSRRSRTQLELAVVEYIAWFNHERLHESLGDVSPVEFEDLYVGQGVQLSNLS